MRIDVPKLFLGCARVILVLEKILLKSLELSQVG